MIREFSAGGIVFKKFQISNFKFQIKWLVCQHSHHKGWVFPKGFIGDHPSTSSGRVETKEEAALREVEEETGIKGRIIEELPQPATYFYVWKGEKRFKTVYYFLMEFNGGDTKNHDFEMSEVEWLTEEDTKNRLTYKGDKKAFEMALEMMKDLK